MEDVRTAKIEIIRRCLTRIEKVTRLEPASLDDFNIQDVFVLNLQRAIQAAIDLAHLVIKNKGLNLPSVYIEVFEILEKNEIISKACSTQMQKMCGFRNVVIHNYREIKVDILKAILTKDLMDIERFYQEVLALDM